MPEKPKPKPQPKAKERPETGNYSVAFTALTNGENVGCGKYIEVAYDKRAGDHATLILECSCGSGGHQNDQSLTHPIPADPNSDPDATISGTHEFYLTHPDPTQYPTATVKTKIVYNNVAKSYDERISIPVGCPPNSDSTGPGPPSDQRVTAAPTEPIEIYPIARTIQLTVGRNKDLEGTYRREFGRTVFVAVQEVLGGGRERTLYLAKATSLLGRWGVTLPYRVWGRHPRIAIHLLLTRSDGRIHIRSFPTQIR